jgi:hypothetical protein
MGMAWEELDERTLMRMWWLGDFKPTLNRASIKGWMHDKEDGGVTEKYLTIGELRDLGRACFRVAMWLEIRKREDRHDTQNDFRPHD